MKVITSLLLSLSALSFTACGETPEQSCTTVMGLALRGSGEVSSPTGANDLTARALRRIKVDFKIHDSQTPTPPGPIAEYEKQVEEAAQEARDWVRSTSEACPGAKLILTGYSQGAHGVHLALTDLDPDLRGKTYGVLIADPTRNPREPHIHHEDVAGSAQGAGDFLDDLDDPLLVSEDLSGRVISICHARDWVCNSTVPPGTGTGHGEVLALRQTEDVLTAWMVKTLRADS